MASLMDYFTGKQAVDTQKKEAQQANDFLQEGIAQLVRNLAEAGQLGAGWDQRVLDAITQEFTRRQGELRTGASEAQGYLTSGYDRAAQAERDRFAQQSGLIREGMGMDRASLAASLQQALGMQKPATDAYGQMISASLPALMSAMGVGGASGAGLPLSALARLQMEDTGRQQRAAVQRAGLEGSGMAAAQDAASRRRIMAEDEQNQWGRLMQMLQGGLSGVGQAAGVMQPYAMAMGGLGNRLNQVNPVSLSSMYQQLAQQQSGLAGNLGTSLSALNSKIPETIQGMGQNAVQNLYNQANARFLAPQASSQNAMNLSSIQPPSGLATLGQIASIGSQIYGLGQNAGIWGNQPNQAQYGYFGKPGSWSNPTR